MNTFFTGNLYLYMICVDSSPHLHSKLPPFHIHKAQFSFYLEAFKSRLQVQRDSKSRGLEWGLKIFISNKF